MKRQIILLGRLGTVFVAVGLALLLVSLIPSYSTQSFASSEQVPAGTFRPLGMVPFGYLQPNFTFYGQFFTTLTPQEELNVKLASNGTIGVYLLKISLNTLFQSVSNSSANNDNATLLESYLTANPGAIAWQGQTTNGTVDYTPTSIINATLVFSNPTQNNILLQYNGKILNLLAPQSKTRTLAFGAIPIGFIMTLPWIINSRKPKNHKDPQP